VHRIALHCIGRCARGRRLCAAADSLRRPRAPSAKSMVINSCTKLPTNVTLFLTQSERALKHPERQSPARPLGVPTRPPSPVHSPPLDIYHQRAGNTRQQVLAGRSLPAAPWLHLFPAGARSARIACLQLARKANWKLAEPIGSLAS